MGGHPTAQSKKNVRPPFARTLSCVSFLLKRVNKTRAATASAIASDRKEMGVARWVGLWRGFRYKINKNSFDCIFILVLSYSLASCSSSHLAVPGDFLSGQRMMERFFIVGRGRGEGYGRHGGQHIRNQNGETHALTCQQHTHTDTQTHTRHTRREKIQKLVSGCQRGQRKIAARKETRHDWVCVSLVCVCE